MKKLLGNFLKAVTFTMIVLCLLRLHAQGQITIDGTPSYQAGRLTPSITPGGYFDTVFDAFGHPYLLGQLTINDTIREFFNAPDTGGGGPILLLVPPPPSTHLYTGGSCLSSYFNIYLEDGCGMDPSDPLEAPRLHVLEQVLCDLSNFINSPCTSTGQKVNIWVRAGLTTGLGVASPFYFGMAGRSGIIDNTEYITINSGIDAYRSIAPPMGAGGSTTGAFFHGILRINFVGPFTWHTNLSTPPALGEVDLYTVILHEMIHSLGFNSLLNYDGNSRHGAAYNYYTRMDRNLRDPSGTINLIENFGCNSMLDYRFNPALGPAVNILSPGGCGGEYTGPQTDYTPCSMSLKYVSGSGPAIPVYTPLCYESGSSFSHFEDECHVPSGYPLPLGSATNNQYYVMSNSAPPLSFGGYSSTNPGVMKRYPQPEVRNLLCDIGYKLNSTFGETTTPSISSGFITPSGTNLNYYNFGSGCSSTTVIGLIDGINATGNYIFYTPAGVAVYINAGTSGGSILDNDRQDGISLATSGGSFKCLEVLTGTGGVDVNHGTAGTMVKYTPGPTDYGVMLLRYIPVSSTGVEGNITYIYAYAGTSNCSTDVCNIVTNGGFESPSTGAWGHQLGRPGGTNGTNATDCWFITSAAPVLLAADAADGVSRIPNSTYFINANVPPSTSSAANDHFAYFLANITGVGYTSGVPNGYWDASSINERLSTPLVSGKKYKVSFWALLSDLYVGTYDRLPTHIKFCAGSNFPVVPIWPTPSNYLPAGYIPIAGFEIKPFGDHNWHFYETTLTYTGPTANALFVQATPWEDNFSLHSNDWYEQFGIDDITIEEILPCDFHIPPICASAAPFDLFTEATVCVPGGTFSWPTLPITGGIPTISTSNTFNPSDAYSTSLALGGTGLIPVKYTYTDANGCIRTAETSVQLEVSPGPITGVSSVCLGASGQLSNSLAGGNWSIGTPGSGNAFFPNPTDGMIYGTATGSVTVRYSIIGCSVTNTVTVDPPLPAITGPSNLCVGNTIALSHIVSGGTWTSDQPSVATINPTGIVSGVSIGGSNITYWTGPSCYTTLPIGVHVPLPVTGPHGTCVGSTVTLLNAVPGGLWSSASTTMATVDPSTGDVTGVNAGSVDIIYTAPSGCQSVINFTVVSGTEPITGAGEVCTGITITLSHAITGGSWTSGNTNIATVNGSTGVVSGVASGVTDITYSIGAGCQYVFSITVNPPPPITGPLSFCAGSVAYYTNLLPGGTWSSGSPAIATIDVSTGDAGGVTAGNAIITYSLGGTCVATKSVAVTGILGSAYVCIGTSISLSAVPGGGTWSSDNTSILSVSSTGTVYGVATGAATISYISPAGCTTTRTISVTPTPSTITGPISMCPGTNISLTSATTGGTWSSDNIVIASVSPTGVVNALSSGLATITYYAIGCYTTHSVTINPLPSAIIGLSSLCIGTTIGLNTTTTGGSWSSDATSIATINSTGVVNAISAGSANISYVLAATGCATVKPITVRPAPSPIAGPSTVCAGSSITLSQTATNGLWSSSNATIATVNITGTVTGVSFGVATITYSNSCGFETKSVTVVGPQPITGPSTVCVYTTITLNDATPGGTWSSSNSSFATINASTGVSSGVSAGVVTITYSQGGCSTTKTLTVNPHPLLDIGLSSSFCEGSTVTLTANIAGGIFASATPTTCSITPLSSSSALLTLISVPSGTIFYTLPTGCEVRLEFLIHAQPGAISGASSLCAGSTTTFSNATLGGTWTSSNTSVATINPSTGILSAVTSGTTTVSYAPNPFCSTTKIITVNPMPSVIGGMSSVCIGSAIPLSNSVSGGTWSSSATTRATITTTGIVTGVTSGTVTITYILPGGCSTVKTVTVNPVPAAITGPSAVCVNAAITVNTTSSGGSWSTSNTSMATINPTTRIVSGVSAGVINVSYILPTGCYTIKAVSVNATPPAIAGGSSVCVGSSINLSNSMAGGTWSSSSITLATVTAAAVVTGVAIGAPNISYVLPTGCYVVKPVTVNPLPAPITGANTVCLGSVSYVGRLSDAVAGGTWSSSTTTVATVVAATGVVKGVTAGTTVITYTLPTGCFVTTSITVIAVDPDCTPCSQFSGGYTALTGTITNVTLPAGNYYVGSDIHIAGNVTVNDAIALIAGGVSIIVDPTAALTLKGCHLFSCSADMWQGIVLTSSPGSGGTTGVVNIIGGTASRSSLIEDAIRAVDVTSAKTPFVGAYFVNTNNAIFNKNNTGIYIENYTKTSPLTYGFRVENTVFTSRNFYGLGTYSFPSTWPSTTGTGGLKAAGGSSPYYAPYYIRNYVYQPCNNGASLLTVGIDIISAGAQSGTNYAGVLIGALQTSSANAQLNLFDQVCIGIWGINANVTSNNNVFNEMRIGGDKTPNPHNNGGVGIYTMMDNGGQYKLTVEPTTNITLFPFGIFSTINSFYNCKYGVYAYNYWEVSGKSSYMITNQTLADGTNSGIYGYDVQTYPHKDVTLNNNTIVNIANGISVKMLTGVKKRATTLGAVTINYNTIRAVPIGHPNTGLTYVDKAIAVENSISHLASAIVSSTQVAVNSNTLTSVYNGIYLNGLDVQSGASNSNTISGVEYAATPKPLQFGISHVNCFKDEIAYNTITGTNATNTNWYGVKVANLNLHYVQCNTVSTMGVGFQFENCNALSKWTGNNMTDNRRGFSMIGGQIGQQGSNFLTPADNKWLGSAWGGINYQTYMNGASPLNSKMYVRSGAIPTINFGIPIVNAYSSTNGLATFSGPYLSACPASIIFDGGGIGTAHFKQIVTNGDDYQESNAVHAWIDQFRVWQVLNQYPDEFIGDATFDDFKAKAATSRFKLLTDMENLLVEGEYEAAQELLESHGIEDLARTDTDTVTGVIMADAPEANKIVNNYRTFYQLYIHYEANTLTGADSVDIESLANRCPYTDGPVVYKARALYNLAFDTLRIFENGCDDTASTDTLLSKWAAKDTTKTNTTITTIAIADGQKYLLFPNPNNGSFILQQKIADKEPVEAEIWDIVGRSIYKERLRFDENTTRLRIMNGPPGVYLLQLTDSKNRKFRFKFVIE